MTVFFPVIPGYNQDTQAWACAVCGAPGELDCSRMIHEQERYEVTFQPLVVRAEMLELMFPDDICIICNHLRCDHEQYPDTAVWYCDDDCEFFKCTAMEGIE